MYVVIARPAGSALLFHQQPCIVHFRRKHMHYSPVLLNPPYFLTASANSAISLQIYIYIYVRSAADVFTAHGRGHVRIITLRLFPAAAAEWAKPREIRRPLLASAEGAATAWSEFGRSPKPFQLLNFLLSCLFLLFSPPPYSPPTSSAHPARILPVYSRGNATGPLFQQENSLF